MSLPDPKGPFVGPPPHRLFGVYPAIVRNVQDPDSQGRVQIELPWVAPDDAPIARAWARLATFMAGADRGSWFIPEPDDEVLVAFIGGDPRHPVVIGALWNGVDAPPESMDSDNNIRSITSRSGHKFTFDDTSGAELIQIKTQGGHTFTLDDGSREISLEHSGGASIKIDSTGTIAISALNRVTIDAPAGMTVSTSMLTVDAPMSRFSGVVQSDTVITNAVVSSSYTPGAGNVW